MNLTNSLLADLITEYSNFRSQIYFKSSLNALARAMEDLVLADDDEYLVIANFQQEKFFRFSEHRFQKMAQKSKHVYILAVPDDQSNLNITDSRYKVVSMKSTDTLAGERHLVIIGKQYSACLVVQEKLSVTDLTNTTPVVEQAQRFEGIWTFDRQIAYTAADWLLGRIVNYSPQLRQKVQQARKLFVFNRKLDNKSLLTSGFVNLDIFSQRLVTYLQVGQYKLLKAYKAIATAQRKEILINKISAIQRTSLKPEEIIQTTVTELGNLFPRCRCLLYRLNSNDTEVKIEHEYIPSSMKSLVGQKWSIVDNPLFVAAQAQRSTLIIEDVTNNSYLNENSTIKDKIAKANIRSWLMASIRYQGVLLGMIELHYGGENNFQWQPEDIALLEAVATTTGAALTQATAYDRVLKLNSQLETIEHIQNNLIAIVGHELRTPLSTIRVCLETFATELDMPPQIKSIMLETALDDTERLEKLIKNFLTLSKLEAGKAYRNIELVTIDYALNLAIRQVQNNSQIKNKPNINVKVSPQLPSVLADVDGLVEVFIKLLDNACKFTNNDGEIFVSADLLDTFERNSSSSDTKMLEIVVADTGRGIDKNQLEIIFDRFSQSESYLRRTVSGVGLGLVICRKIIQGMGGEIWANSAGENQGSQFHFTLPIQIIDKSPATSKRLY